MIHCLPLTGVYLSHICLKRVCYLRYTISPSSQGHNQLDIPPSQSHMAVPGHSFHRFLYSCDRKSRCHILQVNKYIIPHRITGTAEVSWKPELAVLRLTSVSSCGITFFPKIYSLTVPTVCIYSEDKLYF